MQIIPVIDLMRGQVVWGRAGKRSSYAPLRRSVLTDRPAEPGPVARAVRHGFGATTCYVADLDSIAGQAPDWSSLRQVHDQMIGTNDAKGTDRLPSSSDMRTSRRSVAFAPCWFDVGIERAHQLDEFRQATMGWQLDWVIGLESLHGPSELAAMLKLAPSEDLVVSVDLRDGHVLSPWFGWQRLVPETVVTELCHLGVRRLILLDLARVGMREGTGTEALLRHARSLGSDLQIVVGGGVRSAAQIARLSDLGADGVLVATAIHEGALRTAIWDA